MITPLAVPPCQLGENPLWSTREQCLYWTDILGGEIHRFYPDDSKHEIVYKGPPVGGFTFQRNGDLLLFRVDDIAVLHPNGTVESLRTHGDPHAARFNDVIADPAGRVFAGTFGRTDTSGGLYRMDHNGDLTLLFRGAGVSNGMGFSPDLKTFYWTCSTRRRIYAFDFDVDSGQLSRERIWYQAAADEGIPDGMTVDQHGHVWSARWDGFSVVHHAPDSTVLGRTSFPVAKVSSLCFGGPNLDEFFVTTAGGQPGGNAPDGSLYRWKAGVSGPAEFHSAIRI